MQCACGQTVVPLDSMEEWSSGDVFASFTCPQCGRAFGAEGSPKELEPLMTKPVWTDEARYQLSRMPFYLAPLVQQEVEEFSQDQGFTILTTGRMTMARNKGVVEWTREAEQRLANVPDGIRAMAKTELERTASDRGMEEVTVSLMEEVKARYFGMAMGKP